MESLPNEMKKTHAILIIIVLLVLPTLYAQDRVINSVPQEKSVEPLREQAQTQRQNYRAEHTRSVQEIQQIRQTPCTQDCSQRKQRVLQAQKKVLLNHVDQLIAIVERTYTLLQNSDQISDATKQRFLPDLANVPAEYRALKTTIQAIDNTEDLKAMAGELQEATANIKLFVRLIKQGVLDDFVKKQDEQAKQTRKEVRG